MPPVSVAPTRTPSHLRALVALVAMVASVLLGGARPAAADAVQQSPPETITICRSSGAVETVAFKDYVKTVLPREFTSSWGDEALKAGAIAIRSYAWYWLDNPDRRLSGRCDIGDTQRYQVYKPEDRKNPPTARTDAAVEAIWHVRLENVATDEPLFSQYCNCSSHPSGRSMHQIDARNRAARGETWRQIITYAYRGMNYRIEDWRDPFSLSFPAWTQPTDGQHVRVDVAGVADGDGRVSGRLYAYCSIGGRATWHEVGDSNVNGGQLSFPTAQLQACAEDEIRVDAHLLVRGTVTRIEVGRVWRPWTSDAERDVDRIADTDDAIKGAIQVSQAIFDDGDARTLVEPFEIAVDTTATGTYARTAIIARSDVFADALSATGLAGATAPILLNRGGADQPLDARVRIELERLLPSGAGVHVVGGPSAIGEQVVADLEEAGFTVLRHAGSSRIETSLIIADQIVAEFGAPDAVLVARAYPDGSAGWADATTGGAFAATQHWPVLLTPPDAMSAEVVAWAETAGVGEAILLGGTAAVPADAEDAFAMTVTRVAGENRSGTAVAIAEQLWSRDVAPKITATILVDLYDTRDWTFALTGAVYAAHVGAPQVATRSLVPAATTGAFLDSQPGLPVVLLGGSGVIPRRIDDDVAG